MNDNKSREIFYGVVAVATLIVALIGATLAYFSMNTGSSEGAVNAQAAIVSVEYNDSKQVLMDSDTLIPSDFGVVQTIYERYKDEFDLQTPNNTTSLFKSDDSDTYDVCSVYRFSVKTSTPISNLVATLRTEQNTFTDLYYAVSVVSDSAGGLSTTPHNHSKDGTPYSSKWLSLGATTLYAALPTCDNASETTCYEDDGTNKTYRENISISPIFGQNGEEFRGINAAQGTEYIFDVVLFILNDQNNPQDYDQGKTFSGNIFVDTGSTVQISGVATTD